MSEQEQDKNVSQDISNAAEAKPTALSDEDLDKVAGGIGAPKRCVLRSEPSSGTASTASYGGGAGLGTVHYQDWLKEITTENDKTKSDEVLADDEISAEELEQVNGGAFDMFLRKLGTLPVFRE